MNNEIQKRQKCIAASEVKGEEQVLGMTPAHSTTKGVGRPPKPALRLLQGSASTLTPLKGSGHRGKQGNLCFVLAPSCSSLRTS